MKKEIKKRYSLLSNLAYAFSNLRRVDKKLCHALYAYLPIRFIIIIIELFIPTIIIGAIEIKVSNEYLILIICSCFLTLSFFRLINLKLESKKYVLEHKMVLHYMTEINKKIMDIDYFYLEYPKTRTLVEKANQAILNNHTDAVQFLNNTIGCLEALFSLVLFLYFITVLNPWLIIFLVATAIIEYITLVLYDKYQYSTRETRVEVNRKLNYFKEFTEDFSKGKDIRIFNMGSWIESIVKDNLLKQFRLYKKLGTKKNWAALVETIVILIRNGFCFAYLIKLTINKNISIAEFLLYYSVINQFVEVLGTFVSKCETLIRGKYQVNDIREFLDLNNSSEKGNLKIDVKDKATIQLENVSYIYPNSDKKIINNFSLSINPYEKIAIVGPNGAGKSTLVKLIMGMYRPTEGIIKINGNEINNYSSNSTQQIFSAVFQKFRFLPLSIAQNIGIDHYDNRLVNQCIHLANLDEKVNGLQDRENTKLIKEINPDGIYLSGGEEQKLMLARAIYKNGLIYVLDEPNASLDALAEDKLYQKYLDLSKNSATVFITHRYTFTRLCDRIIYIDKGQIVEQGSHEQLMKKKGQYWHLYMLQSMYFRDVDSEEIDDEI